MYHCQHDYCPHLHFKKCLNARVQSIPYTIFPDGTIDSFTNVPMRCANLYKSNIPTVAYENYTLAQGASQEDTNFVKNYYLNRENISTDLGNEIVKEQEEDMCTRSAYVLAGVESQRHIQDAKKKAIALDNARRRAIARYNQHFRVQNQKKNMQNQQSAKWLKKLYRKLQEVARHIIQGEGENLGDKQKKFLLSKLNLTANYLSQIKVRNPKVAFQMLQQVRILMMKKKLKFQQQRQQQENNKSVTMSFASQSGISGTNTSQNSMLSQATSLNQSNVFGEDQVVNKYCDFQQLKKKWHAEDIQEVKQILRRVLTRKIVSEAEVQATRKRKQAEKNNQLLRQSLQKKGKNAARTRASSAQKTNTPTPKSQIFIDKINMTKEQMSMKQQLLKGGQFDAVGQKFERNRNYSQMFKNRQDSNAIEFFFKDKSMSFTKDCCCQAAY